MSSRTLTALGVWISLILLICWICKGVVPTNLFLCNVSLECVNGLAMSHGRQQQQQQRRPQQQQQQQQQTNNQTSAQRAHSREISTTNTTNTTTTITTVVITVPTASYSDQQLQKSKLLLTVTNKHGTLFLQMPVVAT